jgi:hypothetical protein
LRAPNQIEKLSAVFEAKCHRVTMLKTKRAKQMRAPVRPRVKRTICDYLTRTRHDDGGFFGIGSSVDSGMTHYSTPPTF